VLFLLLAFPDPDVTGSEELIISAAGFKCFVDATNVNSLAGALRVCTELGLIHSGNSHA